MTKKEIKKEKDSSFYDDIFKRGGHGDQYLKDPEDVLLYSVWKKILDSISEHEKILDIGCGPGQFAQLAIRENKNYILGIDFSKEAIKMAKQRNPKHQNRFILGDAVTDETLYDIDYDIAVLCEILEHVKNDLKIIENIKKRKRVMISLPSYDGKGHIRYFENEKSIIDRYKDLIIIDSICAIKIYNIYTRQYIKIYVTIGTKK